ncbi:Amuc_1099 family pilus-like system protein [Persicirhabdus sediminis]|uniref:Uncharacterized protein n=1 Tax=Persicirhabdus sediminis TaxID=454144 RepID=A0A8J7MC32_9BACT|nr:Amuc_1099 family pilus-like system protein [Persicirhabdus sediminis]MBK1789751.1 hypothetical protein [Persicirhabdus sediminis]
MSWVEENYEKAALGGALIIALGLGVGIATDDRLDGIMEDASFTRKSETSLEQMNVATEVIKSLSTEHTLNKGDYDGREVDLMVGVPLFVKKGVEEPVDLLKSAEQVHPGMENTWWLDNEIDPGYVNSPDLDADGDGFSNREEYDAQTNPNDPNSYPEPIVKLAAVGVEKFDMAMSWSDFGGGSYQFQMKTRGADRPARKVVKPGEIFFDDGSLMAGRFKYVERIVRDVEHPRTKVVNKQTFQKVEDLSENKRGRIYEFGRKPQLITDYTVEFRLNALGKSGETFKIQEGERFSLPFRAKAKEKPYLLKSVDPKAGIEIEYKAGDEIKTINLNFPK